MADHPVRRLELDVNEKLTELLYGEMHRVGADNAVPVVEKILAPLRAVLLRCEGISTSDVEYVEKLLSQAIDIYKKSPSNIGDFDTKILEALYELGDLCKKACCLSVVVLPTGEGAPWQETTSPSESSSR